MALALDPSTREALEGRLRFYRDLGLTEFYRRPVDPELVAQLAALVVATPPVGKETGPASGSREGKPQAAPQGQRPGPEKVAGRGTEAAPAFSSPFASRRLPRLRRLV